MDILLHLMRHTHILAAAKIYVTGNNHIRVKILTNGNNK